MHRWNRVIGRSSYWFRSFSSLGNGNSANALNSPQLSSTPKMAALAITAALLGGTAYYASQDDVAACDSESPFPHSHNEIAMLLREKLRIPREKLKKLNKTVPILQIRTIKYPSRTDIRKTIDVQVIDTKFEPNNDIISLLKNWLEIFEDTKDTKNKVDSKIRQLTEFYDNPEKMSLPLISEDKEKSMTITKYHTAEGARIGITLFKDHGFTVKDVDSIAKGYIEGFCKDSFTSFLSFQMFNDRDYQDRIFRFLEDQHPFSRFAVEYYNDGNPMMDDSEAFRSMPSSPRPSYRSSENNRNRGYNTSASQGDSKEAALEQLRGLGVEVFDQSNNLKLSWDFLAGYDYVKKDIQDTVINAIRYPEIYEQIARKTRVVYESNRPKAVLLEGPPGTGKTLTARILASQCDVPLIVLKLESIVSKWYGDSEKKLAEIMDTCNKLPNSIIFIDELDALAQSRDSEQGIHEVSKRTLSVLLQRLEGFNGKSNSILICATNRKEDLDSALLSRFDLMIKYDLPDKTTRSELFKRYAKQFQTDNSNTSSNNNNKNAYEVLSKISDGLSCRDIKEACEQAERKCASRIVENNKHVAIVKDNISDVPTLDDYIQCLQAKLQDQNGGGKSQPFSSI